MNGYVLSTLAGGKDVHEWNRPCVARGCRPVVVIDPEDAEQVARLRRLVFGPLATAQPMAEFAAALREFAAPTPPKPDEPRGLGAVVEDANGDDWHRTREGRWIAADGLRSRAGGWCNIDAVRVLSEGVTTPTTERITTP